LFHKHTVHVSSQLSTMQ